MPDKLNGIIISEVLADNPNGTLDVNNSGTGNKQDEFVEFQNTTNADIDLTGYQVWSQENGLLHSFAAGTTLEANGTVVVLGDYDPTDPGNENIDNYYAASGNNSGASSGGGFLEDGEGEKNDTIYLVSPSGDYIQLSYGQNLNIPSGPPAGFPSGGTLQGNGETITSGAPNTTSFLRDGDGVFVEGPPTPGDPGVPCFTAGTQILTPLGDVPVERLSIGDMVVTAANGAQPIRWIGRVTLTARDLRRNPRHRPICIQQSALAPGLPQRDLRVSRQHRMQVASVVAERMFGEAAVLVSAIRLADLDGIAVDETATQITYFHIMFDQHQVIFAEGAPTESLYAGPEALKSLEKEAREELIALFPELSDAAHIPDPALTIPANAQQTRLVARIAKNGKSPLEGFVA